MKIFGIEMATLKGLSVERFLTERLKISLKGTRYVTTGHPTVIIEEVNTKEPIRQFVITDSNIAFDLYFFLKKSHPLTLEHVISFLHPFTSNTFNTDYQKLVALFAELPPADFAAAVTCLNNLVQPSPLKKLSDFLKEYSLSLNESKEEIIKNTVVLYDKFPMAYFLPFICAMSANPRIHSEAESMNIAHRAFNEREFDEKLKSLPSASTLIKWHSLFGPTKEEEIRQQHEHDQRWGLVPYNSSRS